MSPATLATLPASDLDALLEENFAIFGRLAERASSAHSAGRHGDAAVWAQTAAAHAWLNPGGQLSSAELERLTDALAAHVATPRGRRRRHAAGRVLHVVTQAYQTGGSTQFAVSWVDQDAGRDHTVCLTRQGTVPVPAKLLDRCGPRLDVVRLDELRGLLRRAAVLRELALSADAVLVHSHPYDVVPGLAFTGVVGLPPVAYVNHADHVFWLGAGGESVLLNMRSSGAALAVRRRGVGAERSFILPRPLRPRVRPLDRAEAKRRLGLAPDAVVVACVADGSKFRPIDGGPGLLDLVVPTLRTHPRALLLAAGPEPSEEWQAAAAATGGRVRALGLLDDPSLVQQAADVHLDSYPFSSLTSLLETAALGTPAVSFAARPDGCAVFGADGPGLDDQLFAPTTPEQLISVLDALLDDRALRDRSGQALAEAISGTHAGAGWQHAVDRFWERAASTPVASPRVPSGRTVEELDRLSLAVMRRTAYSRGETGAVTDNLPLFSTRVRTGLGLDLVRLGHRPGVRDLVPEHLRPGLSRAGRLVASTARSIRSTTPTPARST